MVHEVAGMTLEGFDGLVPDLAAKAPAAKQLPTVTFPKTQAELHTLIEKLRKDGTLNDYLADPKLRDGFRQAVREAFKNEAPKGN